MGLLTDALNGLAGLPQPAVVAATGALVLAECTLGVGFLAPGESGLLIASTTATTVPRFVVLWVVVTLCAVAGDSIGYLIGRRYGDRMRETGVVRKLGQQHWDRAGDFLRRRGWWAVLVARFLPVVRTLMPASAGAANLPYRSFLPASVVGAAAWAALHIGIGAVAGASAKYVEKTLGRASTAVVVALVLAAVVAVLVKRRRAKKSAPTPDRTPELVP
ncbi:DedA family protein [Umezawaea beigongshangensis]|uniref:DedA family protein n=1 Tax=Umezawaea beigongshangensis TaxID=2780383 RepID=UPI0018F198D8|nr:DedA family protein [Umezawaea beigongshangensis]